MNYFLIKDMDITETQCFIKDLLDRDEEGLLICTNKPAIALGHQAENSIFKENTYGYEKHRTIFYKGVGGVAMTPDTVSFYFVIDKTSLLPAEIRSKMGGYFKEVSKDLGVDLTYVTTTDDNSNDIYYKDKKYGGYVLFNSSSNFKKYVVTGFICLDMNYEAVNASLTVTKHADLIEDRSKCLNQYDEHNFTIDSVFTSMASMVEYYLNIDLALKKYTGLNNIQDYLHYRSSEWVDNKQ